MTIVNILLIIILIALNGFFTSMEFAVVSSRRTRLELTGKASSRGGKLLRSWVENPAKRDHMIAASQLGITAVSLALGAVGENAFQAWLEPHFSGLALPLWLSFLEFIIPALPLIISLTVITSLHVVFGEQVPKIAVLRNPEYYAVIGAPIMNIFSKIFIWLIDLLDWATRLILGILGIPPHSEHATMYSLEEIKEMMTGPEVEGVVEAPEREMLSAVIDFGGMLVRQVVIPRTEMIGVEASTPVLEVINIATKHAFTKLPVYEENMDQVIGIIHLRDLVAFTQNGASDGRTARDVMRDALYVPETVTVNQLLHQFRLRKKHMAIVLDEYGGTAGLVTLEDLVEEIIGDVQNPFESTPPPIQALPDGSYLIDGLALIEEVNEHLELNLQDEDYDTIAGFVLGKLGRIAQVGDIVEDPQNAIRLSVEELDGLRIARLKLSYIPKSPQTVASDVPVKTTAKSEEE
jgi:putative hemolysin